MIDLAFFNTNERTEYSDELYAVVGRALTVATHYDNNCKALANTMDIRLNINLMENPEEFQSMLKKWSRRQLKSGIDKFTSTIKAGLKKGVMTDDVVEAFEETIFKFLDEGREARNFICHELALGMSEKPEDEKNREEVIDIAKEQVCKIAKADFFISVFIENHINKMNLAPSLESYIERITDWVCKAYD